MYAVAKLWRLDDDMGFLSSIARQGSGSACRSLFGGWVRWTVGSLADGSDSRASQVADHLHWPEMRVLVLVVSDKRKDVPSTDGMQRTVATSPMIPERVRVVPERMAAMEHAILERDYEAFAHLTMLDSDHFHELCHTTEPPIHYMNDVSRAVVALVRAYNAAPGGMKVRGAPSLTRPRGAPGLVPDTVGRSRTRSTLDRTPCCTCASNTCSRPWRCC